MERRAILVVSGLVMGACSLVTNLDDLGDASVTDSAPLEAPATCFALGLTPTFVTADPGDPQITIGIQVARAPGFNDTVTFSVTGGLAGVQTSAPSPAVDAASSSFAIDVPSSVTARGDYSFVVTGTAGACVAQASVALHIGSTLVPNDAGVITVPDGATSIVVKAWGAAGGSDPYADGAVGGGGGFASARFTVPPGGTAMVVVAGSGGRVPFSGAGGGGGYSGVHALDGTWWLVAGGGGGAGSRPGNLGGGGGGTSGGVGQGCGAGSGGTQTSGGGGGVCVSEPGEAGVAWLGGAAGGFGGGTGKGGVPGGGAGNGGGGGGGGWFGGGGAAGGNSGNAGGGGGSGYMSDAGIDATLVIASSSNAPNSSDPDYVAGVGNADPVGGSGGAGNVVVKLVKP